MSTNYKDIPGDLVDWISIAEASRIRGVSRQAISKLVKQGRLSTISVAGRPLVNRKEVTDFERMPAGRPARTPK